ncbi:MAG: ribosome maturation factor RimM [Gammaproteobacteria bacterium]|nr:ribosome maturation factor RimM [Gammaproteobacteria bacterium]
MNIPADNRLVVGRIHGLFGVQGWVKILSYTQPRENILQYSPWYLGQSGQWQAMERVGGRRQAKIVIAKFRGIDDRDLATGLLGAEVAIQQAQLESLPEGEYYWMQLVGLRVVNLKGNDLGVVDYLLETGANDVLVLKGNTDILIPFVQNTVVKDVALDQGVITVDWDVSW